MNYAALLPVLLLALSSCTPAAMEGLGRGLSSASSAPRSIALSCTGTTHGTFTSAVASLSLSIQSTGAASGTFTNNGTVFQAQGTAPGRDTGTMYTVDAVNLTLDSRVSGGASGLAGVRPVGLSASTGSTGSLSASFGAGGVLTGTFRGIQGSYRLEMRCD